MIDNGRKPSTHTTFSLFPLVSQARRPLPAYFEFVRKRSQTSVFHQHRNEGCILKDAFEEASKKRQQIRTSTHTFSISFPSFSSLEDPSPLTWNSFQGETKKVFYTKKETREWTLKDALEEGQANGHFFYRKVGRLEGGREGGGEEEVRKVCALLFGAEAEGKWEEGGREGGREGGMEGGKKRRGYHLRVPTKQCVGGVCPWSAGRKEGGMEEGEEEMLARAKRLEALAKGRR